MREYEYEMKIKLRRGEGLFGPGIVQFLKLTEETGSMQEACEKMGMAYSKGWKILKSAEEAAGQPLLQRVAGGSGGGGSKLTDAGRELVDRYTAFVTEVRKAADKAFSDIYGN